MTDPMWLQLLLASFGVRSIDLTPDPAEPDRRRRRPSGDRCTCDHRYRRVASSVCAYGYACQVLLSCRPDDGIGICLGIRLRLRLRVCIDDGDL